jgi:HTH-type transcriptional regulator, bacterioopsin transcriptional activator and related proteins
MRLAPIAIVVSSIRVLVVGVDNGGVLESEGHTVRFERGAAAALERLDRSRVDCVVSEYRLPDGDGLSLLREVRDRSPTLPFVLYTAHGNERVASDAITHGVTDYVLRDEEEAIDRLVDAVESIAESVEGRSGADGECPEPTAEQIVHAIDEAPIGITLTDPNRPDNPIVYLNDAYERLTGYDPEFVRGRNCRLLQGPESDPGAVRQMRDAVDSEEPVAVELLNYREDGTPFWNRVDISPIFDERGELVNFVGFQTDVSERKRAERELERRTEALYEERKALDRLVSRIDGLLDDVVRTLVGAADREEIEREVCAEIANTDGYRAAWIAGALSERGSLRLRETAGDAAVLAAAREAGLERAGPVRRAIESATVETVTGGELNVAAEPSGNATVAIVPLTDGTIDYGVLCAHTDATGLLDVRERAVLGSIGRMTASAITAVETRRALTSDHVTELGFEITDPDAPLVRLSEALDRPVRCTGATVHRELARLYLLVEDPPEDVDERVSALGFVDTVVVVGDGVLLVTLTDDEPFGSLAECGASIHEIEVEAGREVIWVTVAPGRGARTVASALERRYDTVELLVQREREREGLPTAEFVASVRGRLTDRQLVALETAYRSGYFDWPRPVDGSDLATSMDIARQTFHQHLRSAQRKLLAGFFDGPD